MSEKPPIIASDAPERSGKQDRWYYVAKDLYVRDSMNIPQVKQAIRTMPNGEYISENTLRKWRGDNNWNEDRRKRNEAIKSVEDRTRAIGLKVLETLEKKIIAGDEINTADMDLLTKANKVLQDCRDPRDVLKIAADLADGFIAKLRKTDMKLAETVRPLMVEYLTQIGEAQNG